MVEVAQPRKAAAALKLNNASSEKRSGVQHQHTDIIVVQMQSINMELVTSILWNTATIDLDL